MKLHAFSTSTKSQYPADPSIQDNKDGFQNVQLVMMGNGEENFGPPAVG